jgi:hypothetical protein
MGTIFLMGCAQKTGFAGEVRWPNLAFRASHEVERRRQRIEGSEDMERNLSHARLVEREGKFRDVKHAFAGGAANFTLRYTANNKIPNSAMFARGCLEGLLQRPLIRRIRFEQERLQGGRACGTVLEAISSKR